MDNDSDEISACFDLFVNLVITTRIICKYVFFKFDNHGLWPVWTTRPMGPDENLISCLILPRERNEF